jgi:hypothetical protein
MYFLTFGGVASLLKWRFSGYYGALCLPIAFCTKFEIISNVAFACFILCLAAHICIIFYFKVVKLQKTICRESADRILLYSPLPMSILAIYAVLKGS